MLCPISGANWNNGANAGAWAVNLNNSRTRTNTNVGFRADSTTPRTPQGDGGDEGDGFLPCAKSAASRFLVAAAKVNEGHLKRTGNLYDKIITEDALMAAFEDASRGKRTKRACFRFERRLGANIHALALELDTGTYRPLPYYSFDVREPKPRRIYAPAFRDRVVQHAIYRVIQPIFDRSFIDQSFACRPGKGTHAASDYVQQALRSVPRDSYYLQLDIRRYYYSLDRTALRELIERKIKCRRTADLIMMFAEHDSPFGVPIGNLLSQMFGLIYLNSLDHYIKRELRARHYARYVDDLVLIGLTKEQAESHRLAIIRFLRERLHLELSKSIIAPVTRGINFVGYRTWASKRFVRKRAMYTFRRAVKRGRLDSVVSSLGHAQRTASRAAMFRYLQDHHHDHYRQLPKGVYALHHYRHDPARRRNRVGDDRRHDIRRCA